MRLSLMGLGLAGLALAAVPGHAATVADATNDFLAGFIGPNLADLDVTSFSVVYDSAASKFRLSATLAGAIDPSKVGIYVIGANTGTGTIAPFAGLGQGNVKFNQAITVRKNGTGAIGATVLDPSTISISGNAFSVVVPLSLLPSTGFTAINYGFNLWPRVATGNNNQISDFSPENATLSAVPEAGTWAMLLFGFGAMGLALRRRPPTTTVRYA